MSDYRLVYIDQKPDGTPFYVGMGTRMRIGMTERNQWHTHIREKHPTWTRGLVFAGSRKDCVAKEIELIAFYGRKDLGKGTLVNLTDGGEGLANPSETTRQLMSIAKKGKKQTEEHKQKVILACTGKKRTEETRQRISTALTGKKHTPERIKNMSIALTGRKANNGKLGTKQSEESKAKTSASMILVWQKRKGQV